MADGIMAMVSAAQAVQARGARATGLAAMILEAVRRVRTSWRASARILALQRRAAAGYDYREAVRGYR